MLSRNLLGLLDKVLNNLPGSHIGMTPFHIPFAPQDNRLLPPEIRNPVAHEYWQMEPNWKPWLQLRVPWSIAGRVVHSAVMKKLCYKCKQIHAEEGAGSGKISTLYKRNQTEIIFFFILNDSTGPFHSLFSYIKKPSFHVVINLKLLFIYSVNVIKLNQSGRNFKI